MKRLRVIILTTLLMFIVAGCDIKEDKIERKPELSILSGSEHVTYEYDDVQWQKVLNEGVVYAKLDMLEESLALYYDYDSVGKIISVVRLDKQIYIDLNENSIQVDEKKYSGGNQVLLIDDTPWLALNYFEDVLGLQINIDKERKSILIKDTSKMYKTAIVNKKSDILELKDGLTEKIGEVVKNEKVIILSEDSSHFEILTNNQLKGMISKDVCNDVTEEPSDNTKFETKYKKENKNIFLAWDQNYQSNPTEEVYGSIKNVNVLSPIWLTYKNDQGDISSRVSEKYLEWAKNNNIDVWVAVTNDFNPQRTHELLKNPLTRRTAIENMMTILEKYKIEGLNIDFENIYLDDKDLLVQFIAELTAACHGQDISVSMDVTMMGGSDNWSKCYDRKKLGEIVDYLVIMAYDQHWASSPVSGTVAGATWVEEGLEAFLEIVPSHKIVLGMPLYTRVWKEVPSTEYVNTMKVKSKAITMAAAERIISEKELTRIWDEVNGQYYVAYIEEGTLYKIWHEDFESLALKAELIKKYNVAGAAVWRRGYEAVGTWEVIQSAMGE